MITFTLASYGPIPTHLLPSLADDPVLSPVAGGVSWPELPFPPRHKSDGFQ